MGHPDGAHTHGGGGFGPMPILAVLGAALVAGPVLAAVGELVHILLIAVAIIGSLGAVGLVALIAFRVRHPRRSVEGAARAMLAPQRARAAQPLPAPRPAIERPQEVHLHLHGVSAEDIAAAIEQARRKAGG
jgi:hypothetical protein